MLYKIVKTNYKKNLHVLITRSTNNLLLSYAFHVPNQRNKSNHNKYIEKKDLLVLITKCTNNKLLSYAFHVQNQRNKQKLK